MIWLYSILEKHILMSSVDIISNITKFSKGRIKDEIKSSNILALGIVFIYLDHNRVYLSDYVKNRLTDISSIRNRMIHSKYQRVEKMKCYQLIESFYELVEKWQSLEK